MSDQIQPVRLVHAEPSVPENNNVPRRRPSNEALRPREHLTVDEVRQLRRAVRQHSRNPDRDELIILASFRHGFRLSELRALNWADVVELDSKRPRLIVHRAKKGKATEHPIEDHEVTLFKRLRGNGTVGPVLVSEQGRRVALQTIQHVVRIAGQRAKLPWPIHHHMLRHSLGFHLRHQGKDVRYIAWRLGHRSLSSTMQYLEVDPTEHHDIDW